MEKAVIAPYTVDKETLWLLPVTIACEMLKEIATGAQCN